MMLSKMKYFWPLSNYYLELFKILAEATNSELELVDGEYFYDPIKDNYNNELRDRLRSNKRTLEDLEAIVGRNIPSSLSFYIQDMLAHTWCYLSNICVSTAAYNIEKR